MSSAVWPVARLGDVTESMKNGIYRPASVYAHDGIACLRMYNIDAGKIVWRDNKRMRLSSGELADYRLLAGDILVNRVNSRELVAKAAVIPDGLEPIVYESKNIRLRLNRQRANSRFISYQLLLNGARHFSSNAQQVVGMASISQKQLSDFPVVLPPLVDQERSVAESEKQFSRLDEAVANLKRVKANLKRYRAAVLKAAVEGRLVPTEAEIARREGRSYEKGEQLLARILAERRAEREKRAASGRKKTYAEPQPPDTSNLPELPEGWVWAPVEQMGTVQLGRQRSPKNRSKKHPVKYLRAANITENGLDLSDVLDMEFSPEEQEHYRLTRGDLILSEASGSAERVGKPAVWKDERPLCCFQNTVIRLRPACDLSDYLLICFKSFYHRGIFAEVGGGVGINHLSAEKFSRVVVPLAPTPEQVRIVADIERRLSMADESEAQVEAGLRRAEGLRRAILKQAFEA